MADLRGDAPARRRPPVGTGPRRAPRRQLPHRAGRLPPARGGRPRRIPARAAHPRLPLRPAAALAPGHRRSHPRRRDRPAVALQPLLRRARRGRAVGSAAVRHAAHRQLDARRPGARSPLDRPAWPRKAWTASIVVSHDISGLLSDPATAGDGARRRLPLVVVDRPGARGRSIEADLEGAGYLAAAPPHRRRASGAGPDLLRPAAVRRSAPSNVVPIEAGLRRAVGEAGLAAGGEHGWPGSSWDAAAGRHGDGPTARPATRARRGWSRSRISSRSALSRELRRAGVHVARGDGRGRDGRHPGGSHVPTASHDRRPSGPRDGRRGLAALEDGLGRDTVRAPRLVCSASISSSGRAAALTRPDRGSHRRTPREVRLRWTAPGTSSSSPARSVSCSSCPPAPARRRARPGRPAPAGDGPAADACAARAGRPPPAASTRRPPPRPRRRPRLLSRPDGLRPRRARAVPRGLPPRDHLDGR